MSPRAGALQLLSPKSEQPAKCKGGIPLGSGTEITALRIFYPGGGLLLHSEKVFRLYSMCLDSRRSSGRRSTSDVAMVDSYILVGMYSCIFP